LEYNLLSRSILNEKIESFPDIKENNWEFSIVGELSQMYEIIWQNGTIEKLLEILDDQIW
jgi:hypothetical protein